ncbi:MAG: SUMF1/EgtB/PvdO family nonheme iron enzyme [Sulfuritalea sp.]|nr:SUMF1/EgtB/PvdO family nonheme iron enzyme [Sulfuritalea sp.]
MNPRPPLLVALATLLLLTAPAHAERLGLVIGINQYHGLVPLRNAVADAEAIAAALRGVGFRVPDEWVLKNPGRRKMIDAVNSLAAATKPGDEVFVYYSGHGVQIKNQPLMMPADVRDPVHRENGQRRSPSSESDIYEATEQVKEDGISLQAVANKIAGREPRLSMLVVDACRNNPVIDLLREAQKAGGKGGGSSATTGFEAIEDGKNQVVIFAAAKGEEALDRLSERDTDPNSVFARVLLKKMRTPGLGLSKLFNEVREEVPLLASQRRDPATREPHRQHPKAIAAFGMDEFYFTPPESAPTPAPKPQRVQVAVGPSDGAFDVDDLEKQKAVRKQWQQWQAKMKAAFDKVAAFDDTAEAKVVAWDRYLSAYAQDNPFSADDELLRARAQVKRDEAQGAAEQRKAETARQQQLAQQVAEEASRRAREEEAQRRRDAEMRPGKVFRDCDVCPEMVVIPAGSFEMGSSAGEADRDDDEGPVHRVSVRGYALGKTEVTQRQWRSVMGSDPPELAFKGCDECPVERVSWNDAQEYVKKLSSRTGKSYRLPSEAEWEYGCRAGKQQRYCGSDDIDAVGWYDKNSDSKTHAVAGKQVNGFGLYDMSGNVWEWVQDCKQPNYNGVPSDGSAWESCGGGVGRVLRGGAWGGDARNARAANRVGYAPGNRGNIIGFRPARTLP